MPECEQKNLIWLDEEFEEEEVDSTKERLLVDIEIRHHGKRADLQKYLADLSSHLIESIPALLEEYGAFKCWVIVDFAGGAFETEPALRDGPVETQTGPMGEPAHLSSGAYLLMREWDVTRAVEEIIEKISGRGHVLMKGQILRAHLQIGEFNPLKINRPMKYASWKYIPLPPFLEHKKAIINVHNMDNRSMGYAVLSFLHRVERSGSAGRPSKYDPFFAPHGLAGIKYPVEPRRVGEIEDRIHCRINLFTFYDEMGQDRAPIYVSDKDFTPEIDLLFWIQRGSGEEVAHYAWIKNFNAFIGCWEKNHRRLFCCKRCCQHFASQRRLDIHRANCPGFDYMKEYVLLPMLIKE